MECREDEQCQRCAGDPEKPEFAIKIDDGAGTGSIRTNAFSDDASEIAMSPLSWMAISSPLQKRLPVDQVRKVLDTRVDPLLNGLRPW